MSDKKDVLENKNKGQDSASDSRGARRKILRTLVTGGGVGATAAFVPATWTKPVVDAVTLPAHAQTSGAPFNGTGLVGVPLGFRRERPEEGDFEQFVQSVRDMVLPEANAGQVIENGGTNGGGGGIGTCLSIFVANLGDPGSPCQVTVTSQFGGSSSGNGTLAQLLSPAGIVTNDNFFNVVATALNPNGTGTGTVNGDPFSLTPGQCLPIDGEIRK